jgi:hypothetical protein
MKMAVFWDVPCSPVNMTDVSEDITDSIIMAPLKCFCVYQTAQRIISFGAVQ